MSDTCKQAVLRSRIQTVFDLWSGKLVDKGHVPIICIAMDPAFGIEGKHYDMSCVVGKHVEPAELLDLLEHVADTVRQRQAKGGS